MASIASQHSIMIRILTDLIIISRELIGKIPVTPKGADDFIIVSLPGVCCIYRRNFSTSTEMVGVGYRASLQRV
jgi:hypothetical protein